MKAGHASSLLALMMMASMALSAGTAVAAAPKEITRVHQPHGKLKASAFAPRPTKRRVFGAPIQAPILHKPPPKKPQ